MRHFAIPFVAALTACGPMYQQPAQSQNGPQQVQGPPGADTTSTSSSSPTITNASNDPSESPAEDEPPEAAPRTTGLSGEATEFVEAHNRVRAKHCAPPLAWSPKLAKVAQGWANTLKAKGCKFDHMPDNQYGENLAMGTTGALDPSSTVAMWYDEVKHYKFPAGGFSGETGHFTQVVWRGTTEVGCAHAQCNGNEIYVCEYNPPGNYEGQYQTNVLPIGCK